MVFFLCVLSCVLLTRNITMQFKQIQRDPTPPHPHSRTEHRQYGNLRKKDLAEGLRKRRIGVIEKDRRNMGSDWVHDRDRLRGVMLATKILKELCESQQGEERRRTYFFRLIFFSLSLSLQYRNRQIIFRQYTLGNIIFYWTLLQYEPEKYGNRFGQNDFDLYGKKCVKYYYYYY